MGREGSDLVALTPTGVLAMEALHRQVLPFLLRRMKEDVLQDLPPKIIQDYYCNLSPLQVPQTLSGKGIKRLLPKHCLDFHRKAMFRSKHLP